MRTLYTFFRSSTSYRARIALSVKGLDWEPRYISLPKMEQRGEDFLAVNPQGLVPALVEEDGRVYAQSLAILEYLDEAYPEPPFLPADLYERAYVRRLSQIIACDIHPLNNIRVLKWLKANWPGEWTNDAWYSHWVTEGFRAFEACLIREGLHGAFCLGDRFTMADICLAPQVANARRFNVDLAGFPLSVAIADRIAALPAVKRVAPETQGDAF